MRFLITLVLIAPLAWAQTSSMATTRDGSVLLFTSPLRLAGAHDGPERKVFRWDGEFSLVHSPPSDFSILGRSDAFTPVISGDGRVYGYSVSRSCVGFCVIVASPPITYVVKGETVTDVGTPMVSRNGRYALGGISPGRFATYRRDLDTGERLPVSEIERPLGLTDDGRVLLAGDAGLRLAGPGEQGMLIDSDPSIWTAAVTPDGARVLYSVARPGGVTVLRIAQTDLATTGSRPHIELSDDGSRALILESAGSGDATAWWIDLNTLDRHDLGTVQAFAATLSGDGRIVWLIEPNGRLVRVRLDSGEREPVGEPEGRVTQLTGGRARGSLNRIYGVGLDGIDWRVTIANDEESIEVPVLSSADTYIDFQIPWMLPASVRSAWVGIGRPGAIFEHVLLLAGIAAVDPQFWRDPGPDSASNTPIKAVHEDYSRLVTADDPARPGELVHIYMTGLGPVAPPQRDWEPAPADPPARIVYPFVCRLIPKDGPGVGQADVRFVGLAPFMTGVYLAEVEIPPNWTEPNNFICTMQAQEIDTRSASGYLPLARE